MSSDAAVPGEGSVETLWSSTLEWQDSNDGWPVAYAEDFGSAGWSEDGQDCNVWFFAYAPIEGELWLRLASLVPAGGIPDPDELTLHVGGVTARGGDALSAFAEGRFGVARGIQENWKVGDRIPVRLMRSVLTAAEISIRASFSPATEGTATGTIVNTDAMPLAWIARFGRTVVEQVLEAVDATARRADTGVRGEGGWAAALVRCRVGLTLDARW